MLGALLASAVTTDDAASSGVLVSNALLTSGSSQTNGTTFVTNSITPSADKLITIEISSTSVSANDNVVPTISGCSLTWQDVDDTETWSTWGRIAMLRTMGASPSAGAVTITFSAAQDDCLWVIREWSDLDTTGTHGSGAIVQSATNQNADTASLTVTLSAFADPANTTYGIFGRATTIDGSSQDQTPGTGLTELSDFWIDAGNYVNGVHSLWRVDSDTTVDSSTVDTFPMGGIAVELTPAAAVTISASLSGTALTQIAESEIVAGGKTIIISLSNDTWAATVGADNAITTALIAGLDSAQSEAAGWDAEVKANLTYLDVTRTSDNVVTILLPASASYVITAQETITVTPPATALVTSASAVIASPVLYANDDTASSAAINWATEIAAATGGITEVSTEAEFAAAVSLAGQGDVILILDGTYTWSDLAVDCSGTPDSPIIITAKNDGMVTFQNAYDLFDLTGSYNIIGGFTINSITNRVFDIYGGTDNRITDNACNDIGPTPGGFWPWVEITQQAHRTRFDHNTVDNCSLSIRLLVNDDAVANGPSLGCRIDNNTFQHYPYESGPVIQVGQGSETSEGSDDLATRTIIEHNYLNDCWLNNNGTIQIKCGENIIRYNESLDSSAMIYQRAGNYNDWYGNYQHGVATGQAMNIGGSYHKIYNNITDCPNMMGLIMQRTGGTANPCHDNLIAHNTWLSYGLHDSYSTAYGMIIGVVGGDGSLPQDPIYNNTIVNNIIIGTVGEVLRYEPDDYSIYTLDANYNNTIDNNIWYATGTAGNADAITYDANAILTDPSLSGFDLTVSSTNAIDAAIAISGTPVTVDYYENARDGDPNNDIGAVEYIP